MSKKKKKKGMNTNAKWGVAFLVEFAVFITMVVGYGVYWANNKMQEAILPWEKETGQIP